MSTPPPTALALFEISKQAARIPRGAMSPILKPAATSCPGEIRPRITPEIDVVTTISPAVPIDSPAEIVTSISTDQTIGPVREVRNTPLAVSLPTSPGTAVSGRAEPSRITLPRRGPRIVSTTTSDPLRKEDGSESSHQSCLVDPGIDIAFGWSRVDHQQRFTGLKQLRIHQHSHQNVIG